MSKLGDNRAHGSSCSAPVITNDSSRPRRARASDPVFRRERGWEFIFWATPGGSVEADETDLDAARRGLKEELAVNVTLTGPVYTSVSRFPHKNVPVENTDVFFVGRLDQADPKLSAVTDDERAAMQTVRWWTCDEVDQATETIFPPDLS